MVPKAGTGLPVRWLLSPIRQDLAAVPPPRIKTLQFPCLFRGRVCETRVPQLPPGGPVAHRYRVKVLSDSLLGGGREKGAEGQGLFLNRGPDQTKKVAKVPRMGGRCQEPADPVRVGPILRVSLQKEWSPKPEVPTLLKEAGRVFQPAARFEEQALVRTREEQKQVMEHHWQAKQ